MQGNIECYATRRNSKLIIHYILGEGSRPLKLLIHQFESQAMRDMGEKMAGQSRPCDRREEDEDYTI